MTLPSEWELIKRIKALNTLSEGVDGLIAGIGDDCAVFEVSAGKYGLITTDISIENVHFRVQYCTPEEIGFKAMTGNISDIAAMGGRPLFAFISLGLPDRLDAEFVDKLYRGMMRASGHGGPRIAGGDISSSQSIVISITLYGETGPDLPVMRSGALPGDTIYLTGCTGGSLAGLEILGGGPGRQNDYPGLVARHVAPENRLACAPEIIARFRPTAMIDVSDGLLSDLRHLCEASGTGFLLHGENIPMPAGLGAYAAGSGKDPLDYALHSGEEFELLFTSGSSSDATVTLASGIGVTPIGVMTRSGFILSRSGSQKEIEITGYDHFKWHKDSYR